MKTESTQCGQGLPLPRFVRRRPTGFVARCQCGKLTGAMDYARMDRKEAGKILGLWLAEGCTIEPRFEGSWQADLENCSCEFSEPNAGSDARRAGLPNQTNG